MKAQLFPRLPRRMKQPPKSALRDQLASITEEVIQLRAENQYLRAPWWRRLMMRKPR
jgi:hypothetical protein